MRRVLPLALTAVLACGGAKKTTTSVEAVPPPPDERTQTAPPDPNAKPAPHAGGRAEDKLAQECRQSLQTAKDLQTSILSVKGARDESNTLVPMNHLLIHLTNGLYKAGLFANVHPDAKVREAGDACEREISSFMTDLGLNRDLFEATKTVDVSKADAVTKRLVERMLRDFRRAGVDKDDATRKRLKELENKAVEIGQTFQKNIREDVRSISVAPAQLDGLPEDYKKGHAAGADGKVKITTDYPDFIPFMTYAKDGKARSEMYKVYTTRGYPKNTEVFRELLAVRQERAKLLGYADWADYVTEDKMIKSAKNAQEFIDKINKAAMKRSKKDLALLLARKKKDDKKATTIDASERQYYEELVRREKFSFDSQEARPYFEYNRTMEGLLTIMSRLFGVEFKKVPKGEGGAETWHEDVYVYDVVEGDKKRGRIYLDMHPREGKYKHAAQFDFASGVAGQQLPEAVLVCNFPNPKTTTPALMEPSEVETMFHEFGHLMHTILGGEQKWVYFSGVATERDFVEAPSQMLEEWVTDTKTLQLFAKHYENGQPIPDALVTKMRKAAEFGKGVQARHQMFYAALSLQVHRAPDPKTLDMDKMSADLTAKYSPFKYIPDTHFWASFGHLDGYSAMYYTYMWSLVIAKDMFSQFEKNGLLDPTTAKRYRESVLAQGGSKDAADLVKDFLGREYGFESYRKWLDRD
jgi:thimet oligopeptidase